MKALKHKKHHSLATRLVLWILAIAALQFAAIEGTIIANGKSRDYKDTSYVIILGAGVWGTTISPALDERLKAGVSYLEKYPESIAIVSGGQGRGEDITEAEAMKRYLVERGIDEKRIIKEDKSTSTMENFQYSRRILKELTGRDIREISIITSNFHIFRAKMLAKRNGFTPYAISCKTPASVLVFNYFREYFALIKSFFIDRNTGNDAVQTAVAGIETTEEPESGSDVPETLINTRGGTVAERFSTPEDFEREKTGEGSFREYLRNLSLKPHGSKVKYFDGRTKVKDSYLAVVDIDTGDRDLQQCADSVIRLRAEYLFGKGLYEDIHFNFTSGFRADYSKWMNGYRVVVRDNDAKWVKKADYSDDHASFRKYLDVVFAYAGTLSLSKEMKSVPAEDLMAGDVFIKGGSPGHAVIVLDTAVNSKGDRLFMLAQGYMPAQDIHILKNPANDDLSPWYSCEFGDTLETPEWSFESSQLMRFEE